MSLCEKSKRQLQRYVSVTFYSCGEFKEFAFFFVAIKIQRGVSKHGFYLYITRGRIKIPQVPLQDCLMNLVHPGNNHKIILIQR